MRIRSMVAVLALVCAPVAAAQDPGGPPGRGAGLFAGITLTAEQQQQIDSIRATHEGIRAAMQSDRQPGQGADSARMAQRAAMRSQMRSAYRAVLTPDQQVVFDRNAERMESRMGPRGPARRSQ